MGDVQLLEAYKDAYRQSKLWGVMQNTEKNKDADECFNYISPIRKKEPKIYVKPEKLKQFKKTEKLNPVYYISKYITGADYIKISVIAVIGIVVVNL